MSWENIRPRTFHGDRYRVRVTVWDPSLDTPPEHPTSKDAPTFAVSILPQSQNTRAPFSTGTRLYHGKDFHQAWMIVKDYAPEAEVPKSFKRYERGFA